MSNLTPKFRPVFGQKYPLNLEPVTKDTETSKAPSKPSSVPLKKLKPKAWPDSFTKMNPTERILFAYTAFRQPKDENVNQFYGLNYDSFRLLDTDLPGPSYQEISRILTKWTKLGFMEVGAYSNSLSLKEGVTGAFFKFINQQTTPLFFEVEPDRVYPADLTGTLDNLFNFLVMVDHGEVSVTISQEINKHSLKRILAGMTEPVRPHKLFSPESYFFWLLGVATFFKLIGRRGDHLVLSTSGTELPERIKVEDFLCDFCSTHFRSIHTKGFFILLPLLARCTTWTSWGHMVRQLIKGDNTFNMLRQDRVISFLDPLRFLGLLDWGEYEGDILVRVTPLGQFMFQKLYQAQALGDHATEIKSLTDQVYPMSGPDTAYVQPNFEILLPHSASWTTRWALSQFAALEHQDQMMKYRLDKTCLLNALKRGVTAEEVIPLLTKLSPCPIPENVVITLQQWMESFGQVSFLQLSLLECTTSEQAASIASARKYKGYVFGLYSPTAVIVREPEKLRKLLEKQGIFPLPGILEGEDVAGRKKY